RLNHARADLGQEEARVAAAQAEAERRLAQTEIDTTRESALAEDARAGDARLGEEYESLAAAAVSEAERIAAAVAAASDAQGIVDAREAEFSELTRQIAAGEAQETAVRRRLGELEGRVARLRQRAEEIASERVRLQAEIADDSALIAARDDLAARQSEFKRQQSEGASIGESRTAAEAIEVTARAKLQGAQAAHAATPAGEEGPGGPVPGGAQGLWASPGNLGPGRRGFAAARGADLTAAADAGAPVHWQSWPLFETVPALPGGAEPMTAFMQAPTLLTRRLMQIGVVADETEGRALAPQLAQGQRLVTRDGAM